MGYGGIDFDSVDVSKLDEQVAASAQRLEAKRTEEDKSIWDKAKETAGAVYDTVANEAEYVAGVVENTVQDMTAARNAVVEGWSNWQHQGAKLQEKAFKGELTEDDVNALRQAGTDLTADAWKAGLSPVRQVAREVISHTADNPESPFQPIGQSIQQTKANLQYFMTSEEKAQKAREIEKEVGIPADIIITDDDAYKAALDVYNFKQRNDDIENVWKEYPELWNIGDMDSQAIALALHNINDVRTTHGIVDSFTHFIQQGNIKLEYDNLQYKIMSGEADDNDRQRAKDLRIMMDMDKKTAPSFFDDPAAAMAAGVAQSLPEMGQGIKEGAETALPSMVAAALFTVATGGTGAVAVGGAAGMAALRAALMRAIGSQGVKKVGTYAFQLGMFRGMQKPESGSRYEELGELKDKDGNTLLTDDERRGWAMLGGSANALIETANVGIMLNALKPYPHAARVFGDIVENAAMRKSTQEKLASLAADKGKDWLKLTVSESAEEAAQSAADDLIHNAMVADKGERASNLKTYDASDILGRSAAAFAESLPGSAGFGLLGAGGGFAGGVGNISRQARRETKIAQTYGENAVKTMNGTIMVEQLQQAVASGKLKEKAPDVQQKILREQLAGSGYEMAYIDIETATQKETGMEDLKKVADAAGMTSEELETAVAENGFLAVPTEVLSQVSSSPDLLDSVSFSEEAESMARMRETNKQVLQSYEEAMKETIQRKADLIENLMKNTMPNATEEQRAMIEAAIMTNPDNPAQGWNSLQKEMQGQLDEILAPALKALKEGMGKAGIMDVKDEIGNDQTVRYSENDAWYRNFYKQFKRQPTKAELEDMAIAMVTGDPSAPQVQGWIPDSQEMQEAMGENEAAINLLRNNIKALDEIKGEMQKLTGVEMELTAGLSPEAVSMYRQVYDWAKSVGGSTARQARMGAILAARHADIYAKKVTEKTGRKYTAVDYMREKLGFSIRPAGGGLNQIAGELYEITGDENVDFEPDPNVSYRFYNTDGPMSRAGYAMFADNPESVAYSYGPQAYTVNHDDLTDVNDVIEMCKKYIEEVKKKEESSDFYDDSNFISMLRDEEGEISLSKANEVLDELNPADIVDGAEAYDNEDMTAWLYENIIEPNEIKGIKTFDGAIVFDEEIIKPDFEASVYYGSIGTKILGKFETLNQMAPLQKEILIDGKKYRPLFGGDGVEADGKVIDDEGAYHAVSALEEEGSLEAAMAELERESNSSLKGLARRAQAGLDFLKGKTVEFRAVAPVQAKPKAVPQISPEVIKAVEVAKKTYGPFEGEGFNPRSVVPKVRGGWTEKKILKYLKEHGTPYGVREAVNLIAEFDNVEELKAHMFFHGSAVGASNLKPSITMSDKEIERRGGGGYGEKYWGISVTPSKKIASNFSGESRSVNIYPLILAKNAIVEEAPELEDAADIAPHIVDYWTRGVDAVWIGNKDAGEQELLILNPRAVVNIGRSDTYDVLQLGTAKNPLRVKDDEAIARMLDVAKALKGKKEGYSYASPETREEIFFQKAWHGSPYDFETFDLGAIGSGEGAQVHGWGLYFAKNREVSEGYRERLALDSNEVIIDGETYFYNQEGDFEKRGTGEVIEYGTPLRMAVGYFSTSEGKVKDAIESLQKDIKEATPKKLERWGETWNKAIDILEKEGKNWAYKDAKGGKLFQVEIPDDDVLLDEQKTFNEQPEKVQKAIKEIFSELERMNIPASMKDEVSQYSKDVDLTGKDFYDFVQYCFSDPKTNALYFDQGAAKAASELLNKHGIKGITYEGGQDGRCFVIFDDKAIDVIEKYNQRVARQQVQGQTSLMENGKRIVSILETADESTFMHEMAHVFLYDLEELAQIDDVSAKALGIVNEWAEWRKGAAKDYKGTPWAGEFAKLEDRILDAEAYGRLDEADQLKRQWKHERFARAFEIYLRDGQAPAKGLKAVFRKFKQFLRQIYAAFTSDGARASEPVKRVMDRMIASEAEIEAAELEDRYADVTKAGGGEAAE